MIVNMDPDTALLHRYAEEGSQNALAEVVRRHVDLVYAAALRRTGGDAQRAADVAQRVFVSLAKNARKLAHHPALAAWLHTATRNVAITLMKAEQRRRVVEAAAAKDPAIAPETAPNWNSLQPVIDSALDELPAADRVSIVLRFFQQASFREVAAALGVSEDAARMRTDRALQKLRKRLAARGVTSTAAALGLVLGQQAIMAAPAGVAAAALAQACATTPLSAGAFSFLIMTKVTAPLASGIIAASLTAGAWIYLAPGVSADELHLLQSENARLVQATGPTATEATLDAVAQEYVGRATNVAQLVRERFAARSGSSIPETDHARNEPHASRKTGSSADSTRALRHEDHGLATPRDSFLTFAWASDAADVDALARMIWMDPEVRQLAIETMAKQPKELVAQYPAPEQFYGFITAAVCLQAPPPGADVVQRRFDAMQPTELRPGRLKFPNNYEFQQTPEGWKWVLPESAVTRWLHVLNDSVLTKPAGD
jgi:RNA polymerase sigma factor (sigma-70 family)